jgi:transglutaminase-like putative cysteine protease
MDAMSSYKQSTWFVDSDTPAVREFAERAVAGTSSEVDRAVALYYAVRDDVRYDPYTMSFERDDYRASAVLELPSAFCIQKSVLLAAAARAVGLPSRLGFADVRNHLTTPKLREAMGSDFFVYHGFTEIYVEGKWVKSTPAFNLALCQRFGVRPLEFDGQTDSIFHPFDAENRRHMEYVRERGSFADLPFDEIIAAFHEEYPGLRERLDRLQGRSDLFRPGRAESAG